MSSHYSFIGIIPARYASTRFPGKPLVDIGGKSMIQRVFDQASEALKHVYVATDDNRIYDAVKQFGGKAVFTSSEHKSGTDRCAEAIKKIESSENKKYDIVINIQGDEPFIQPLQIQKLMKCFSEKDTQIATLIKPFTEKDDIFNPNKVKVVINKNMDAIYFSRAAIPYIRNVEQKVHWTKFHQYYLHIGMYAFRRDILSELTILSPSGLEMAESLEQLRWLENGYKIKVDYTEHESIGIDTPEDLERIRRLGIF